MSAKRQSVFGDDTVGIARPPEEALLTFPDVPPDSIPIADALLALRGPLTVQDCGALGDLVGVRTLGDLRVVLDRGEIAGDLGEKLKRILKD